MDLLYLGWPENTDALRQFHPTSVMVSGFDIIFFWIARMIMMTMHFIKDENGKPQVPFHTVYMTGLIRDDEGQKMSKSAVTLLTHWIWLTVFRCQNCWKNAPAI